MGADTTQIRISKSINSRLSKLASDSGYNKEQLVSVFLNECLDAVNAVEYSDAPLPCVENLRKKLKKPSRTIDDMLAAKFNDFMIAQTDNIAAIVASKLSKKKLAA